MNPFPLTLAMDAEGTMGALVLVEQPVSEDNSEFRISQNVDGLH